MGIETKRDLSNAKFEQEPTDVLSLSGCTDVFGSIQVKPSGFLEFCDTNITSNNILFNIGGVVTGDTNLKYCKSIDALKVNLNSCVLGQGSVALACGYTMATADGSVAMSCGFTSGCYSFALSKATAYGPYSFAHGLSNACGDYSVAMIKGNAFGTESFVIGGNIACSNYSSVIGGCGNVLLTGNTNSIILGGSGYTMSANNYSNTVAVPNLLVWEKDVEIMTIGCGVILKSPNGNRWRITVDNSGAFVSTAL